MKRTAIAALFIAFASSAHAEDKGGSSLIEEGARLFFEGLMKEMEPALEDLQGLAQDMEPALRDFAQSMGPALRDLMGEVKDWSAYHPPEILPNGDIILRKKRTEDRPPSEGEIDL